MDLELTETLIRSHPLTFKNTRLGWFECGDGWAGLLGELFGQLETHLDHHPDLAEIFEFTQIKEKFGTLRVYYGGGDDVIAHLIAQAENRSALVCELCGNPGSTRKTTGWLYTACDIHATDKP